MTDQSQQIVWITWISHINTPDSVSLS